MSVNIPQKVLKFESFINDVLKEELKTIHEHLNRINSELVEYIQLKSFVESLIENDLHKDTLKSKVDIGCNIYLQAAIPNPSQIYIDIGLGYSLLFTLDEALKFINKRSDTLKNQSKDLCKKGAEIRAHIKLVLHGIQELQKI